jgi:hypothetical protein
METILKWRNPNEIPETGRRIEVLYKDSFYDDDINIYTKINKYKEKVTFIGKSIVAWAYADNLVEVENSLKSESNFNQEWIDKLHDLACKGVGTVEIDGITLTAHGYVTTDCIRYVAESIDNFSRQYSLKFEIAMQDRRGVKNAGIYFYEEICEKVFEYLDDNCNEYCQDDVYDDIDYVFN